MNRLKPISPPTTTPRSCRRARTGRVVSHRRRHRFEPDGDGPDRLTAGQRKDLMEIVEDRYQAGATIITSQRPVNAWRAVIDEPAFVDAIFERLIHNAHRLPLDGPSLRKTHDAYVGEDDE